MKFAILKKIILPSKKLINVINLRKNILICKKKKFCFFLKKDFFLKKNDFCFFSLNLEWNIDFYILSKKTRISNYFDKLIWKCNNIFFF